MHIYWNHSNNNVIFLFSLIVHIGLNVAGSAEKNIHYNNCIRQKKKIIKHEKIMDKFSFGGTNYPNHRAEM